MKATMLVNFSEIFEYAEKHVGWSWNKCCQVFFDSILRYHEVSEIYLTDTEAEIEYQKGERQQVYQCIVDFMKENNLTSMSVKS